MEATTLGGFVLLQSIFTACWKNIHYDVPHSCFINTEPMYRIALLILKTNDYCQGFVTDLSLPPTLMH